MKKHIMTFVVAVAAVLVSGSAAQADTDKPNLTQQINPGTAQVFVGDTSGAAVVTPAVTFPSKYVSASMQTSDAVLADGSVNNARLYIDNPGDVAFGGGWNVDLAASDTANLWVSGGDDYDFDGATPADGQLTVDATSGTATITGEYGGTGGLTQPGAAYTFAGNTNTPANLLSADGSVDIQRLYLSDIGLSQTIPAGQASGSYSIEFMLTLSAA